MKKAKKIDASQASAWFISNSVLADAMKRALGLFVVLLLAGQSVMLVGASSNLSTLTDAGLTQELNQPLVLWHTLNTGQILSVDNGGNLSVNTFSNGVLSTQWYYLLNVQVNKARIDAAEELVSVAHQSGALVIQLSTASVIRNITTPDPVNDAVLDGEGDLWLMYSAGKRRADQYDGFGFTGVSSTTVSAGISAFEILEDGRLVLASYDKKIYINSADGQLTNTLTEPDAIVSSVYPASNTTLLAGTTGGTVYRYNTDTWAVSSLSMGHTKQTTFLGSAYNMYLVGAKQGKVSFLDVSNFSLLEGFTASGDIVGVHAEFNGPFYAVGTTPDSTKIRYFDLDADGDGVNDRNDAFPNDATQSTDSDDDGYGDNPSGANADAFPNDATQWSDADGDGYGDNVAGNNPDLFPNNADQWSDADGDGYGDNINGMDGDVFPSESTQWSDSDRDGYGDNPDGFKPDACPTTNAFSTVDRYGCPDKDLDGYSDPDENWTVEDGADALPNNPTQWLDGDSDGYGDASDGQEPDSCPWEYGKSTKAVSIDASSPSGYVAVPSFGCVDQDGDGWVDRTESPLMDNDPTEHFDGDGDGVGSNSDYDDTKAFVQTEQDHCLNDKNDTSEACQGWNNPAYQAYRNGLGLNESPLGYNAWNTSQQSNPDSDAALSVDEGIVKQVVMVGLAAFVALTVVILLAAFVLKQRATASTTKEYGGIAPSFSSNASQEALEGRGGLSAAGGIIADASWDDDVEQLDFNQTDGFADMDLKADDIPKDAGVMTYEEESIESIAGMPVQQKAESKASSLTDPEMPAETPPLPEGGLPDGWTMDQWRWYGHEWLAKYGKN